MPNTKVLVIVGVLVVIIVAAGVFLALNMNGGSNGPAYEPTGRLMILGNADNNDDIDKNDVSTIRQIIKDGTWDKKKYPYADANNDGSITEDDVKMVEKIIDKTVGRLYYVNKLGEVKGSYYPLTSYVAVGSYAINSVVILDSKECKGVSGSKVFNDELFWIGLRDLPKISGTSTTADYDLVTQIPGIQAVVGTHTGINNEKDFNAADIDVIRLDFNGYNELAAMMILGFLTCATEKYHAIAESYDAVTAKVQELIKKHPEFKNQTAMNVYKNAVIYSDEGAHGFLTELIGIENCWKFNPSTDEKDYQNAGSGDSEWYLNDRFKCDYIVEQYVFTYVTDANPEDGLSVMNQYFKKMGAYPDNTVIVNGSIPQHCMIAYMIEGLFPDDIEKGYGDKIMQGFLEEFVPSLTNTGYDVTKDCVFLITPAEIREYMEKH